MARKLFCTFPLKAQRKECKTWYMAMTRKFIENCQLFEIFRLELLIIFFQILLFIEFNLNRENMTNTRKHTRKTHKNTIHFSKMEGVSSRKCDSKALNFSYRNALLRHCVFSADVRIYFTTRMVQKSSPKGKCFLKQIEGVFLVGAFCDRFFSFFRQTSCFSALCIFCEKFSSELFVHHFGFLMLSVRENVSEATQDFRI